VGLNKSKGNMYSFVTNTWNPVKGKCLHDCKYCYMKKWYKNREQPALDLHRKELFTDLGSNNFIFVGSSCDLFADDVEGIWLWEIMEHCNKYPKNKYLFQTKNPESLWEYWQRGFLPKQSVVCTTIETNRVYLDYMGNTPTPSSRAEFLSKIDLPRYVTIEPIMDFDMEEFVNIIRRANPIQVNIGADSGGHRLHEPSGEKLLEFTNKILEFTTIHNKKNIKRLF